MEKRILHILNGLGDGGAETFIMNVYRSMDKQKIQFDFLLRTSNNNANLINEVRNLGANIYIVPSFPEHMLKNYFAVCKFFKNHKYDIIHVHANALIYIVPFIVGKKYGVSKCILHSHNTKAQGGIFSKLLHYWHRNFVGILADEYLACGREAGYWMFKNKKFMVLNNAIDSEKYAYNLQTRKKVREKLHYKSELIFGHIGRFVPVKNHVFLLEIFLRILEKEPEAKLMLIGRGELLNDIVERVKKLNLQDNVLFMGQRDDVYELLQAMDGLIFPSIYEGLPFTLIEAQAAGVPILASDSVSEESKITELIEFYSLDKSPSEWADRAIKLVKECQRKNTINFIKNAHYDIQDTIDKLVDCYTNK